MPVRAYDTITFGGQVPCDCTAAPAALIPIVSGDASRLQQIASNLLVNAVKFSHEGKAIDIRLVADGRLCMSPARRSPPPCDGGRLPGPSPEAVNVAQLLTTIARVASEPGSRPPVPAVADTGSVTTRRGDGLTGRVDGTADRVEIVE